MKVYHGSLLKVEHPKILTPSRTLDYGKGFYTTTSAQQATYDGKQCHLWLHQYI